MSPSSAMHSSESPLKSRSVTAVLGPTNTGKTHLAIERMLAHQSGMIGLPLRLLAREVYDKIAARVGADSVALVTGEEKIKPASPRYWVSTVEAMPRDIDVQFLAVDEVQLGADLDRGHVFTERLLSARGVHETLLLGASTIRETIKELLPHANFVSRPRLSKLTYAGQKKMSRLPRRSAIVAFSAAEVYEIAELIRRQKGGAAVVLGALSPRTRNAQVALYQAGEVDYLVATDAIGMGINLDVDHVAFAGTRKFDGRQHRELSPAELGQIAGRAGRHTNDGTFGVTGEAQPFETDLVDRIEKHDYEPVKLLQWRNTSLDLTSLAALRNSLAELPRHPRLTRARAADDLEALEALARDPEITRLAATPEAVRRLWEVCQLPDFRKISPHSHAELVGNLYHFLMSEAGRIPEDWFARQVAEADRTDGDIDTLATRIAHIRTWTFVSNRSDWLEHPEHWQGRTREIEDTLSDALHTQLTLRFVDRRTSTLMRRLRDEDELAGEIGQDGTVQVENHFVGKLIGFRFQPDLAAEGIHGKAARNAATQVVAKEIAMRARRVASAANDALKLTRHGRISWRGDDIARLERSEDPLKPAVSLLADDLLSGPDRDKVQARLEEWTATQIAERLKPLVDLGKAEDVTGLARGIAFRLSEGFGIVRRESIADELRQLDQAARASLRKYGVRFGAFNIYFPLLLKPAAAEAALTLWRLAQVERGSAIGEGPEAPRAGLTSIVVQPGIPDPFYRAAGFHTCGPRAVRVDMLERLADMIRPLIDFRVNEANPALPPKGASGDGGFMVIPEMMSILGCSQAELGEVLKALGFRLERRPKPAAPGETKAPEPAASAIPAAESIVPSAEPAAGIAPELSEPEAASSEPAARSDAVPPPEPAAVTGVEASAPDEVSAPAPEAATATAAEPVTLAADAVATVAEPEFIEIWRPRRRRHEQHGEARHAGSGERRGRRGGQRHRPEPAVAAAPSAEGGAPPAAEAPKPEGERDHRRRDERRPRREGQGRPGSGGDRGPRPEGDRGPRHRERDHRRRDGGGRSGPPEVRTAEPARDKRQAYDPNSPFAALSQLKQQLEERQRNQTPPTSS